MDVSAEVKTGDRRVIEYWLLPAMQAVNEAGRKKEMTPRTFVLSAAGFATRVWPALLAEFALGFALAGGGDRE